MLRSKFPTLSKRRSARGSSIAEFGPAIFVLLLVFLPACNFILFLSAYLSLHFLTKEAVAAIAMSDTMGQAEARCKEWVERYQNPLLTMVHQVKLKPNPNKPPCSLAIIVQPLFGNCESYNLSSGLPVNKQPDFRDNRNQLFYFYRLAVPCTISPIFNLSGIPMIAQVPIIGAPTDITFIAQAQIENVEALIRNPNFAQITK